MGCFTPDGSQPLVGTILFNLPPIPQHCLRRIRGRRAFWRGLLSRCKYSCPTPLGAKSFCPQGQMLCSKLTRKRKVFPARACPALFLGQVNSKRNTKTLRKTLFCVSIYMTTVFVPCRPLLPKGTRPRCVADKKQLMYLFFTNSIYVLFFLSSFSFPFLFSSFF